MKDPLSSFVRPSIPVIAMFVAAVASVGGAALVLVLEASARLMAGLVGLAIALAGLALAGYAKQVAPDEPDEEERKQKGPDRSRRNLILGAGASAAALTVTAVAFPAVRRLSSATDALRSTPWSDGVRLVEPHGNPVHIDEVPVGDLLTVYPEGAVGSVDGQAVLIRAAPERFNPGAAHSSWVVSGIAVYSKLCTHMACPLGLYQEDDGTLLCPCHQALFDVLDGGRAVKGPARRALPQLPIRVSDEGFLVATGGFSDAVGTGFWGRP